MSNNKPARFHIPFHLVYLLKVYLAGAVAFTLFRLLQFITESGRISTVPEGERFLIFLRAFWIGFRFDMVILAYILLIPFLALGLFYAFRVRNVWPYRCVNGFVLFFYVVGMAVYAIDIPWFHQFHSRLNRAVLQWTSDGGFIFRMIVQEPRYFWTVIPLVLLVTGLFILGKRIFRSSVADKFPGWSGPSGWEAWLKYTLFHGVFFGLMFIGGRGRLAQKSPIRVGTAFFSPYAFPNQLGLNPVFTLTQSMIEALQERNRPIALMDPEEALSLTREYLHIPLQDSTGSPLARWIIPAKVPDDRPNVVLVLMESMTTAKMGRYGNTARLTPHLDSLASNGWAFDSIFTAGIHTHNGVYSTLFSYPALFEQHQLKQVNMLKYHGLPAVLKQHGYQTAYFTTHDDQFDNIGGFLSNNGVDRIISQKDFPQEEVRSTLGVPDDFMFRFSVPLLDEMAATGKPFLGIYMTASDHGPYIIPEYFQPRSSRIREQAVEYADWSIGRFMDECSRKEWFGNTLFVFIADHGAPLAAVYDMPLNYHHSPLVFYGPGILEGTREFTCLGGQIDVFPTLMGLLKLPYLNNTLGVDLLEHERPYIYFCADNKYGVLDNEFFLVVRKTGRESLFRHLSRDLHDYRSDYPEKADEMKRYAAAQMQAAQWMITNRKTGK